MTTGQEDFLAAEADLEVIRLREPLDDRLRERDLVLDGLFSKHNFFP